MKRELNNPVVVNKSELYGFFSIHGAPHSPAASSVHATPSSPSPAKVTMREDHLVRLMEDRNLSLSVPVLYRPFRSQGDTWRIPVAFFQAVSQRTRRDQSTPTMRAGVSSPIPD